MVSGIAVWQGRIGSGDGERRPKRWHINAASMGEGSGFYGCRIRVTCNANHKVKGTGYQARPIHLVLRLGGPSAKARLGRGSLDHLMEAKH